MNNASGTVAPPDPELIQVGDAVGQHDPQMPLIPYQGPVQQLTPAAADPALCTVPRHPGSCAEAEHKAARRAVI